MEEDTEYKKLPVDERCIHKLWKARLSGYEDAIKIFREIDDEKSPEWNKFVNLIKKFVIDPHAMAQERGLEATLIFVENCAHATKIVGEVVPGIVSKCIAAPKAKTKELSVQVILMFIEIDKQEAVIEEMIKGVEHKNPKIVAACTATITQALREFGSKVIGLKPIIKQIPTLLSDRDKNVRDETKLLAIEIYRWIGMALKPQLASLSAVLLAELESEFEKLKKEKVEPTRYLKSQQLKQAAKPAAVDAEMDEADDDDEGQAADVDPMDLIDPVDIISQLPKDFYDKLEEKKWQTRKESLEVLDNLLKNPKLATGDYGELLKALRKILLKDSNVILVGMAGKSMAAIAKGLGKKFSPYASGCVPAIFEKFKEKKTNVVTALREAIDAMYPSVTLEAIQEDVLEALNNKNPNVKAETALFLARALCKTIPTAINKKLLKTLVTALIKTLNESDPMVRDASAEALGTLLKLLGDKMVGPFIVEVDALKMAKIKECAEKAVLTIKVPAVKKVRAATAPPKPAAAAPAKTAVKPVARPATGVAGGSGTFKKPAAKKAPAAGNALAKSASTTKMLSTEREMSPEEVDEKVAELLAQPKLLTDLVDANWKTRLSAVETFSAAIEGLDSKTGVSQTLIKTICKKPGLKDTNFQVLKIKLEIIRKIVETYGITTTTGDFILNDVAEKLGDSKNNSVAGDCLTAIAEAINLEYVLGKVLGFAFEQKSPKVQIEALLWTGTAVKEFGLQANPKLFIEDLRKAVQNNNVTVRQSAVTLLGVLHMYIGQPLLFLFESEKPAIKQQIQTEFDKNAGEKPPAPIRGLKKRAAAARGGDAASAGVTEDDENEQYEDDKPAFNAADLITRVDISGQITEALLVEISDKNWKTRNEGLVKLQGLLNDAKFIHPNIGDLPQALALRLVDSNAKIAQTALAICQQLAEAIGPPCKQYVRVFFPGFLNGLGDGKAFIRTACITCINVWGDQCGYKEYFEGEMIAEALKSGSPPLRIELWGWLAEKLMIIPPKSISKDELLACLPWLYANICDRNVDVRKNANEATLGFMIHLGYDGMMRSLERQKPTSKKEIQAALDKVRPNLPMKPLQEPTKKTPFVEDVKSTKPSSAKTQKVIGGATKVAAPAPRKKEEEIDTSPLLAVNNAKNQRLLDEQKLKVLKWTFTVPREEFTDLLKDQMTAAMINKQLLANMFHDDFRYHLKAIELLLDDLQANCKALICNLDLILKWISLRFYDTNPSVLLKGLDYLNLVFNMLVDQEYVLAENEGSCFIPHLLIKIGDPKDTVRNGVRTLFRQICLVYPFTKVFAYIMEGLKSKNARQRTECLDELGYLIETYGMNVCQPTPLIALKEIARHISDRDNSVRSAALNCVVQAYFLTGEKVYKLIGQLNEKDLSMLDERIKRAKKTRKVIADVPPTKATNRPESVAIDEDVGMDEPVQQEELPVPSVEMRQIHEPQPLPELIMKKKVSGPFGLNQNVIDEIEKDWIRSDQMPQRQFEPVDLAYLHSPLKAIAYDGVTYPADKLQNLILRSRTVGYSSAYPVSPPQYQHQQQQQQQQHHLNSGGGSSSNIVNALPKLDPNLERIIKAIASTDSIVVRAALNELNDILESPEKQAALRDHEEMYIDSIYQQFKNLSQIPLTESLVIYQPVLTSVYTFFASKTLSKNVGVGHLKKIMSVLLGLMADHKLSSGDDSQYAKVINGICLKILERSNFTYLNCALIRLLKETCSGAGLPKFTDLLMKCIWRNVKIMPEKSHELDFDAVLYEVHDFMQTLPSAWWAQRPSDTPLRTVKTIIHNMAKLKGTDIMGHLSQIPAQSELHSYLIRVLKNVQKENPNMANQLKSPHHSSTPAAAAAMQQKHKDKLISKQTHDAMSHIFKLISDKDTSKDGIIKLHEFKMQNVDFDVEPFLKGASPVFKKFIEDGLMEVERSMNGGGHYQHQQQHHISSKVGDTNSNNLISSRHHHHHHSSHTGSGASLTSSITINKSDDADYWMDRLNNLMKNKTNSVASGYQDENKVFIEKNNLNSINSSETNNIKREPTETISANRLEMIQQKLSQIRQQKHP